MEEEDDSIAKRSIAEYFGCSKRQFVEDAECHSFRERCSDI